VNALSSTPEVTRAAEPLVVDMGRGWYGWCESGLGFALDTRTSARWQPLTDVESFRGAVMKPHQVAALVSAYGRPL
jgi:hypothetical protein